MLDFAYNRWVERWENAISSQSMIITPLGVSGHAWRIWYIYVAFGVASHISRTEDMFSPVYLLHMIYHLAYVRRIYLLPDILLLWLGTIGGMGGRGKIHPNHPRSMIITLTGLSLCPDGLVYVSFGISFHLAIMEDIHLATYLLIMIYRFTSVICS